jgi:hypothetical protein
MLSGKVSVSSTGNLPIWYLSAEGVDEKNKKK